MKAAKHGIIGGLLIFLAILIGYTSDTGFSFGDKLFLALGMTPWSNGQTGLHYPFFVSFVLFIIGCLEARRAIAAWRLLLLIVMLFLISPWVVSFIKPVYYNMQSGLAAIEYDSRNSHFNVRSIADTNSIEVISAITLINYGKNTIQFGIKIPADDGFLQGCFPNNMILTGELNSEGPMSFMLHPDETKTILSYTTIQKNEYSGQGTLKGINLILFTNDENRLVGRNI